MPKERPARDSSPLDKFAYVWRQREAAQAEFSQKAKALEEQYAAAVMAAHRKIHPESKYPLDVIRRQFPDLVKTQFDIFKPQADVLARRVRTRREHLGDLCRRLAAQVKELPQCTDRWTRVDTISGTTYRSQGYAADKYARHEARNVLRKAELLKVAAHLQPVGYCYGTGREQVAWTDYAVWAAVDEVGAACITYHPGPSLRELVREAWKNGVNPRVTMWWLPPGYEEHEGLDYFGNDLKGESHDSNVGNSPRCGGAAQ